MGLEMSGKLSLLCTRRTPQVLGRKGCAHCFCRPCGRQQGQSWQPPSHPTHSLWRTGDPVACSSLRCGRRRMRWRDFLQRLSSPGQTQVDFLWKSLLLKKTTTEERRSGKRGSAGLFASLALTMDKGKGLEKTQPVVMSEGSPLWEGHRRTPSELGRPLPRLCLTTAGAFQFLY